MKLIRYINEKIVKLEIGVLVAITMFMIISSFVQVVLRTFFNTGFEAADIINRHLVLWIGFIGASLATHNEKHINVDLFSVFISKKHKKIAKVITSLFAIAICIILAKAGIDFVKSEIEFSMPIIGNIKPFYFELIIPFGYIVIAARFLLNLIENLLPGDK
ncbi:MAG: TRAP transporter small permease [Pseudomonadota bacterium]